MGWGRGDSLGARLASCEGETPSRQPAERRRYKTLLPVDEMTTPVLLPALLVGFGAERLLFPEADSLYAIGGNPDAARLSGGHEVTAWTRADVDLTVDGKLVRLTNLAKPFWPEEGITRSKYFSAPRSAANPVSFTT